MKPKGVAGLLLAVFLALLAAEAYEDASSFAERYPRRSWTLREILRGAEPSFETLDGSQISTQKAFPFSSGGTTDSERPNPHASNRFAKKPQYLETAPKIYKLHRVLLI